MATQNDYRIGENLSLYADGTVATDVGKIVATVTDPHDGLGRLIELIKPMVLAVNRAEGVALNCGDFLHVVNERFKRDGDKQFPDTVLDMAVTSCSELLDLSRHILRRIDQIESAAKLPKGEPIDASFTISE